MANGTDATSHAAGTRPLLPDAPLPRPDARPPRPDAPLPDAPGDLGGAATIDSAHFRAVLGHYATGIVIVTGAQEGVPAGLTCQTFVSLSLDPALVAFCPSKRSTSWQRIAPSGAFCANVLTEEQEDLSRVFATPGADKFRGVGWRAGATGSPILQDVLAFVDCRIEARYDAGDHEIVVGRVVEVAAAPRGRPLLSYRGGYGRFDA